MAEWWYGDEGEYGPEIIYHGTIDQVLSELRADGRDVVLRPLEEQTPACATCGAYAKLTRQSDTLLFYRCLEGHELTMIFVEET